MLLLKNLDEVLHYSLIKVFASKMRVAGRRDHLEDAVVNGEQRDIEGT